MFGTLADFDALLARAHALGLKVIIDQVLSHTSDQHAWFRESRADPDPHADAMRTMPVAHAPARRSRQVIAHPRRRATR